MKPKGQIFSTSRYHNLERPLEEIFVYAVMVKLSLHLLLFSHDKISMMEPNAGRKRNCEMKGHFTCSATNYFTKPKKIDSEVLSSNCLYRPLKRIHADKRCLDK